MGNKKWVADSKIFDSCSNVRVVVDDQEGGNLTLANRRPRAPQDQAEHPPS
jgi:hypothetical protein